MTSHFAEIFLDAHAIGLIRLVAFLNARDDSNASSVGLAHQMLENA
jgi:hypothetical protein